MEGLTGVILVQALHYFPFILVNTAAALAGIDPAAEEAAQSLGCHGSRLLWRVTLPLALPGFGAGALLAFIRVIDDLGTPLMLNYTKMLAPQAYLRVTTVGMNDADGYVICVILVVALAPRAVGGQGAARARRLGLARARPRAPARRLRGRRAWTAWAAGGGAPDPRARAAPRDRRALVLEGVELLATCRRASRSTTTARSCVRTPHFVWNTLRYALLAAGIDVVLGAAIAWLLVRGRVPGRGAARHARDGAARRPGRGARDRLPSRLPRLGRARPRAAAHRDLADPRDRVRRAPPAVHRPRGVRDDAAAARLDGGVRAEPRRAARRARSVGSRCRCSRAGSWRAA